jgi:hypothetical protein
VWCACVCVVCVAVDGRCVSPLRTRAGACVCAFLRVLVAGNTITSLCTLFLSLCLACIHTLFLCVFRVRLWRVTLTTGGALARMRGQPTFVYAMLFQNFLLRGLLPKGEGAQLRPAAGLGRLHARGGATGALPLPPRRHPGVHGLPVPIPRRRRRPRCPRPPGCRRRRRRQRLRLRSLLGVVHLLGVAEQVECDSKGLK